VIHVNADDPEAVVWAAKLAVDYRQKFGKDFVIELIGYRRHGHNETDEPAFTQPLMYKIIKDHPTVLEIYTKKLVADGVISEEAAKEKNKDFRQKLQEFLLKVREGKYVYEAKIPAKLKDSLRYKESTYEDIWRPVKTSLPKKELVAIGKNILAFPEGFTP